MKSMILRSLRGERGVVLPVTMVVMMMVSGLALVATQSGIVSTHTTFRDSNTKRAVAAASAGIKAAIYETNMEQPDTDECVTRTSGVLGTADVATTGPEDGWCPYPLTEVLGDGAEYSVEVSASEPHTLESGNSVERRRIVSTGEVNGVKRRVATHITAATGTPIIGGNYAVFSFNSLDMSGNSYVSGPVGSNANINMSNYAEVCDGNARYGPSGQWNRSNSATICSPYNAGPLAEPEPPGPFLALPDCWNPPQTICDNGRIPAPSAPADPAKDTWATPGSSSWSQSTRVLELTNSGSLTLRGSNYVFCRLRMSNQSKLYIASGATITIWLDKPENCPAGTGGVDLNNNAQIINLNSSPTTLQLKVLGSPNFGSQVTFNNTAQPLLPTIITAPYSSVNLRNNTHLTGAIRAQAVNLSNYARVDWHQDAATPEDPNASRVYFRQDWIDCLPQATAGSAPDEGC